MQNVRRRVHTARLYPVPAQASQLEEQGHTARALWNLLHEWYTCRNGGIGRRPTIAEMDRQLRRARTDPLPGWEWLAQLPAKATQQVLRQYLRAWGRFYRGLARTPNFKRRNDHLAVDVPQASDLHIARLARHWGKVSIPLIGPTRFRWTCPLPGVSRDCPGRITGARLVRKPLGWHVCFRLELPAAVAPAGSASTPPGPGRPTSSARANGDDCGSSSCKPLADESRASPVRARQGENARPTG